MPSLIATVDLPRPTQELFDYLARSANLAALAPPELRLQLVAGPERLQLGTLLHWKARRMGISQSIINEVTLFEEGVRIGEEQRSGPFRRWTMTHRFEATAGGSILTSEVNYEPPGGMLGLLVTAEVIRKDLEKLFAYRAKRLAELFA
jgi:ligand-binding SRPBCC domain-containing protein